MRLGLVALACLLALAVGVGLLVRDGGLGQEGGAAPAPTVVGPAPEGTAKGIPDPFAWTPGRSATLAARAARGTAHPLFTQSPGGAVATAERVARWRPQVEATARAAGVSADGLEALVFLESAGRADIVAPGGLEGAVGLTQILAQTGTGLLGMRVDVAASERYTRRLARAERRGQDARAAALRRARARVDQRFDPDEALAGAGRYLQFAEKRLGREDLAFVSYHMGVGNLEGVISAYGGPRAPSYARLFFDSTPARHAAVARRLASFGDDSSNYLWKLGAAETIMRLFRSDRAALERRARLQIAASDARYVLHPPDADPGDPPETVATLPVATGLAAVAGLELQRPALALALYLGAEVKAYGGATGTLQVVRASADGWTFEIARTYADDAQRQAFQFTLDRLQVLDLIAYSRSGQDTIRVTVSRDADALADLLDRAG